VTQNIILIVLGGILFIAFLPSLREWIRLMTDDDDFPPGASAA
jgi:hypothetical protein